MQVLRFLLFIPFILVTNIVFGQDKPFEGVLYYRYSDASSDVKWGKSDTIKIYVSKKKLLCDSFKSGDQTSRYVLDPASGMGYKVTYKDTGKNYKTNFRNFFNVRLMEDTSPQPDMFLMLHIEPTPVKNNIKLAGIDAEELRFKINNKLDEDTLTASVFLNHSLGIKLSDYNFVIQGFINGIYMGSKTIKDFYALFSNGLPVEILVNHPGHNDSPRLELIKVERTTAYRPLFDLSKYHFQVYDGFMQR